MIVINGIRGLLKSSIFSQCYSHAVVRREFNLSHLLTHNLQHSVITDISTGIFNSARFHCDCDSSVNIFIFKFNLTFNNIDCMTDI